MPKKVRNTRGIAFCRKWRFKPYKRTNDTVMPDPNFEDKSETTAVSATKSLDEECRRQLVDGKCRRQLIAHFFQHVLCSPPMSEWKTAAAAIYDLLGLTKEQQKIVYRVFQRCEAANKRGEVYDGSQLLFLQEKERVIYTDGIEGQIIGNVKLLASATRNGCSGAFNNKKSC